MYHITIQQAADKALAPKTALLKKFAKSALARKTDSAEITIRMVTIEEMTTLNSTYRFKQGPTNVLSFPMLLPDEVETEAALLGDIVICSEVVNREAKEQHKEAVAHWAHMIVHGVFHLLGYDHQTDEDALVMESLEIDVMKSLGFSDPYHVKDENE